MKIRNNFAGWAGLCCSVLSAGIAHGQSIVFNNTSNDLGVNFNPGGLEVGDEITLAGTARHITDFQLQYFLTTTTALTGNETAEIKIYANNGAPGVNGFFQPGTVLFDSGAFNIAGFGTTPRATLDFNLASLTSGNTVDLTANVPDTLTWSIQFGSLGPNDDAGVTLYSPPTVGVDYSDYWENNAGSWGQFTNASYPVDFAAQFTATPEPSSLVLFGLGGVGAVVLGFRRRLSAQQ